MSLHSHTRWKGTDVTGGSSSGVHTLSPSGCEGSEQCSPTTSPPRANRTAKDASDASAGVFPPLDAVKPCFKLALVELFLCRRRQLSSSGAVNLAVQAPST
eukprot:2824495-Rhodomonas_salina.1